jgi:AraC family transcriptional regulator
MSKSQSIQYARRMQKVLAYMENNLDTDLTLTVLSQVAAFSPCHFHRQFSAYTGITASRLVQLLRLQRASRQLVFNPAATIADIAYDSGFANAESFTRAFRKELGQTPSAFRKAPRWESWQVRSPHNNIRMEQDNMQVELIVFPDTPVAALEHHGPERLVYSSTRTFIEWRQANGIRPDQGATYGVHYSDPLTTLPEDYRLDLCVSVQGPVAPNPQGVVSKLIPGGRCARVRHLGSRHHVTAAEWLYREWLPQSGEQLRDFPMYFHYVNVGPGLQDHEMITDVYLPLR